ncbi:MAG TPA: J domain-containing protein [Candidatus Poseidoniaceae archaeon]|nr:MAG TPA: J domain-containing protein [Candidatus Poseidoniales archaeon]HII37783.1 J domain-containing protein [Candidatus Poseidoniaceae archaeon]|tara:strand:- start:4634 stop:5545 length:912 start_codon:yes stop_codon:yes gene_type:complete
MAEPDPYRVLGVSKDASEAEIKRAFRKKARQFHPDRNPGDAGAEAKFKQVQAAHEKIGSAEARREFDQQQQMANMFGSGMRGGGFGNMGGGFEDVLGQMFSGGMRGNMGGNPFASGRENINQPRPRRAKGSDIRVSIDLTVAEAERGGSFSFTFKRLKPNSMGTMEPKTVTMKTNLKPGVKHGTIKRMKGQGHDHPEGESGDVLLTVRIDAGEGRYWDGDTLVQEVYTEFSTLMLGGKVKITLPSGKEGMLSVSPNTRVGDRRRMSGAGIQGGDLDLEFVMLEVEDLTNEQKTALEELRKTGL